MRTLLRNTATGFYFQTVDNWTAQAENAFDFKSTERAIQFVRDTPINTSDLELILAFGDPRFDIRLPIDERFGMYIGGPRTQPPQVFS